ncbi:bifunctional hydroxymethylpyrimidine kinase/phosphomethylpyrimidine kinase [Tamlana sp. 62-3]|uniref:hydroxymethylpyrimidine kinase n=1 Tax=Neotamlana sargassicola TaxID=2883125 RepID=A0A9X1I8I1_9FLAO|nr:bifunctional hydroxymethylpyrimidine kinase/phosphomethylpyrimidine kinase [Tamlana sargassicola]MCB4808754.1 bifunctional hydroxymethylpyrimidine kinase/phosphomethylpyrimidine kinase [Tamlana sargassicola]
MENLTNYNSVLTIAGSDSGGGAGIQADIKSISACGAFAASVITATTAQNTQGVLDIHAIPVAHIATQLDAVLSDIEFGAVKIGMLHSREVIQIVEKKLTQYKVKNIVLDPVMVATSGDKLINDTAIETLKSFLPKVDLITPNIPEAELLLNANISANNFIASAEELASKYKTSVLLKGGHLNNKRDLVKDVLFDWKTQTTNEFINTKVNTKNTHGTGCSLSSSIATYLCLGNPLEAAVKKGCEFVNKAIYNGKDKVLGKGNGPINHFNL